MRIDELKGLPDKTKEIYKDIFNDPIHSIDFIRKLKNYGFKEVGSGAFSEVYSHPDYNFVIKLLKHPKESNINYHNFITKYAKSRRFNEYMPRIYKHFNLKHVNAYVLEKLYPLTATEKNEFEALKPITMHKSDIQDDDIRSFNSDYEYIIEKHPELIMTVIDMYKAGISVNDLHYDNLMKRKDGSYVIIDPVRG